LISVESEESNNGSYRQILVMNTGKALDAAEPKTEKLVGPSLGFEDM
jgi:hypothetical protein